MVTKLSGGVSLLAVDRHLLHDLEGGGSLTRIADRSLKVHNPELTFSVPDHAVSTAPDRRVDSTPNSSRLLCEMKERSDAAGITYFDLGSEGQGIVHVIGPELGLSQPGMTIVCGDSHTCTHGGLGGTYWRTLPSDADACFDTEHVIDASKIAPQVTWGTSPQDVIAVDQRIPDPARESDPQRRQAMEAALSYMGLKPGDAIEGTPVNWVFVGSCTNGRLSDIREAARVAAGRKVAPNVRAWVVPGSEATQRAAEREGLDKILLSAGFEWRKAGCSMCAGINGDIVPPDQRSVSTTNRNFVGRQGPNARTHLASPAMASAAAIAGHIADPRKLG